MVFALMTLTLTHSRSNQRKCVLASTSLLTVNRQTRPRLWKWEEGFFPPQPQLCVRMQPAPAPAQSPSPGVHTARTQRGRRADRSPRTGTPGSSQHNQSHTCC